MGHSIIKLRLPPKSTTIPTPHVHTTAKPRRKQQSGHNKGLNEVVRAKETHFSNQIRQGTGDFGGGIGVSPNTSSGNAEGSAPSGNINGMINGAEVFTQKPARNDHEKFPGTVPSLHPPWIFSNKGSQLVFNFMKSTNAFIFFFFLSILPSYI
ncbi:uncharacterized protein LOC6652750 [Drosophila willistoni]|uniref:uncharacterized protein LOC6652750 n=1 Tax=Drosophila willistoni TaxID=7260 RepID=UPI001F07E1CD|nr:uncharacterized protein LOC6652750 [Drosophila willistoni]